MRKIWLILISVVLCFIACDMPSLNGGMSGEGQCNQKVLRVHASSLTLEMTANCAYEKKCDAKLGFRVTGLPDSLKDRCFGGGSEWKLESFDTSMVVATKGWKKYPISLTSDNHVKFSLIDEDDVEKKYDIDLSGIINSYTVRGDSVDVNVMNGCRLSLYSCNKDFIYGSHLSNGRYSFLITDKCEDHYGYKCELHNQGPSQKDDLNIYVTVYWRK